MVPAYEGKKPYLFVSYAHKDSELVLPIIEELYDRKYRIWYDEGIAPGSEWPKNIADHLNAASGVVYFISDNSLASPNCENEVMSACRTDKLLIQYTFDGHKHRQLSDIDAIYQKEELLGLIPEDYIGDGSGYERNISRKKFGTLWNVLLILAAIFVIVLGIGLYGLNQGWFDAYLPGVNAAEEASKEVTVKKAAKQDTLEFKDSALASALAQQTGNEDIYKPIQFRNDAEREAFYNCYGWRDADGEPTYEALTHRDQDSLFIDYATDDILYSLQYLPNLKELIIRSGDFTGLEALMACPELETVKLNYNIFPVDIPENARFKVLLMD